MSLYSILNKVSMGKFSILLHSFLPSLLLWMKWLCSFFAFSSSFFQASFSNYYQHFQSTVQCTNQHKTLFFFASVCTVLYSTLQYYTTTGNDWTKCEISIASLNESGFLILFFSPTSFLVDYFTYCTVEYSCMHIA